MQLYSTIVEPTTRCLQNDVCKHPYITVNDVCKYIRILQLCVVIRTSALVNAAVGIPEFNSAPCSDDVLNIHYIESCRFRTN